MKPAGFLIALAGGSLHLALLLAPLVVIGAWDRALRDPVVLIFLLIASGFYLADLPAMLGSQKDRIILKIKPARPPDRAAPLVGLLLLATFWAGLLEHLFFRWSDDPTENRLWQDWTSAAGAWLMTLGVALRACAVVTLGLSFQTELGVEPGQTLVQTGIYRHLRHPSETGNLLVAFGSAMLLGSLIAASLTAFALLPLIHRRVRLEDQHLEAAFGEEFQAYKRRVGGMVP